MIFQSKKSALLLLGVTSLVGSRAIFFFVNDPEGPNLLIVTVLAALILMVSLAIPTFGPSWMRGKLSVAILIQILLVVSLSFFLR